MTRTVLLVACMLSRTAIADDECGTAEVADEALAAMQNAADTETDDDKADADVMYQVPVFLHVVRRAPQGEGDMPAAHARAITIDVINEAFRAQSIPFRFVLSKLDYLTMDDATYHLKQNSAEERALWDAAQVKGLRNLNIYIVGPRDDSRATGWAEFLVNPAIARGDHVVLRYYPATGGFSDPLVPVHEVGHWMGLLHTFHFGCGWLSGGDLIRDTPTQLQTFSCAAQTDTCPEDPGVDAIQNIMGYSNQCRREFSPGQIRRMKFLWRAVRGGKGDDLPPPEEETESSGCASTRGGGMALLIAIAVLLRRRRSRAHSARATNSSCVPPGSATK